MVHHFLAIGARHEFGSDGNAGVVAVETGNETRPFRRGADEEQAETGGVEVDAYPAAAAHGIGDGDGLVRLRAEREGAERVAILVEQRFGRFLDVGVGCGGVFQMMPLLIAVAIAIARLEAENFWIAWVM